AVRGAAAERVIGGGTLVAQSQTPEHYVFAACAQQELAAFYRQEMKFRGELGYPPFRRLAIIPVTAAAPTEMQRLAADVAAAPSSGPPLPLYGPAAPGRGRARRLLVQGHADLATQLAAALGEFRRPRPKSRGIMDIEVDPVEWPS